MEIKEATLKDLDLLTEMNIQLRVDEKIDNIMTNDEVKNRMEGFLKGNEYRVFILKNNKINCGYALIKVLRKPYYLRQIYIINEFRNKGLGSKLINQVMDILKIKEVDVDVMVWNNKAIQFYERFGFKKRYIGLRFKQI